MIVFEVFTFCLQIRGRDNREKVGRKKEKKARKSSFSLSCSTRLLLLLCPSSSSSSVSGSSLRDRDPHRALVSCPVTTRGAPPAELAVRNQENVEVVDDGRRDLPPQMLVGLLARRALRGPAERRGDAVDVGVDGEVGPLEREEDDAS